MGLPSTTNSNGGSLAPMGPAIIPRFFMSANEAALAVVRPCCRLNRTQAKETAGQRERGSSIPREERTHGASRRGPSTAGVCGPPVYAGVAGQEDRLAVGIRVRADGWVTTLKQESLRSCEAIGGK